MGRLENIVARNRQGAWPRDKKLTMAAIGVLVLVVLFLLVFTNLGRPPAPPQAPPHVDGVLLGTPHAR